MHDEPKSTRATRRTRRLAVLALAALAAALAVAPSAMAVTLVAPAPGEKLNWVMLRPTVAFDVAEKEQPKWVLLATDVEMKQTIRYCRQFTGVTVNQGYHWGCNQWAIGTDAAGNDVTRGLEWGKIYFWQVVFTDAAGAEARSEVRSFTIDSEPHTEDPSAISDRIFDSTFGDGTELNLGAAAFTNSGLKITKAASQRRSKNRIWLNITHQGPLDLRKSYVRIRSKVGTRYVPVTRASPTVVRANWVRSASERKLKPGRYEYQAFLKSTKNGAFVRSAPRVIVIQTKNAKREKIPAWTPV